VAYTAWLPEPPSANRYWRTRVARNRFGRTYVQTYVSPQARRWKDFVHRVLWTAGWRPKEGAIQLEIYWVPLDKRRRDLSNRIKVLEDALQGVAYHDDSQVTRIVARVGPDPELGELDDGRRGQVWVCVGPPVAWSWRHP
jgi:crossover junction endodeoxyribonuclease RusA